MLLGLCVCLGCGVSLTLKGFIKPCALSKTCWEGWSGCSSVQGTPGTHISISRHQGWLSHVHQRDIKMETHPCAVQGYPQIPFPVESEIFSFLLPRGLGKRRSLSCRARFQAERPRSPAEVALFQSAVTKLVSPPEGEPWPRRALHSL